MAAKDPEDLATFVIPGALRRIAGARFFDRGEDYYADGAVRSLREHGNGVKAVVQGTHSYRVRLRVEGGELDYDCTCPVGRDGDFCKHCVAVGLAWHERSQVDGEGATEDASIAGGEEDLRAYLLGLDKERLASLLLDHAEEDERLHRKLTIRAAGSGENGKPDLSVWKRALDDAVAVDDFVHYREVYDHVSGIDEVIDSIEELFQAGQADGVIELAEHGLETVEQSIEYMDDSDGWLGGLLDRLRELHLEACRRARPDPVELAERLFEWETDSPYDTFYRAAVVYADVLGEAGQAAYRRLAEAEWAKVRELGPGDDDPERFGARSRITQIMEDFAKASGDFDALVAVKSRDLSRPHDFLGIAELYREAGISELALDWAERGWRAFAGDRRDERLREFIADAYQRLGRHDEALALIWEPFAQYPSLATYRQLERHARRAEQWPAWRDKALALVRERIADKQAEPPGQWAWARDPLSDHSLLVEIFLHEGERDGAWSEAQEGGCSGNLWLTLANGREKDHPEDSVGIYKNHIATLLRNTGNRVYEEAVGFLDKVGGLLAGSGQEGSFRPYLTEIRATHRRKRNLIKLLDGKGW